MADLIPTPPSFTVLATKAYERYGATTGFLNFRGEPMPTFSELGKTAPKVPLAWEAAMKLPFEDLQMLLDLRRQSDGDVGHLSDGNHTFNELYSHRIALFIALCRLVVSEQHQKVDVQTLVWRSECYPDGSPMTGWFLMGIGKKAGHQITYHISVDWWANTDFAETLPVAPPFDGHTPQDSLRRLVKYFF